MSFWKKFSQAKSAFPSLRDTLIAVSLVNFPERFNCEEGREKRISEGKTLPVPFRNSCDVIDVRRRRKMSIVHLTTMPYDPKLKPTADIFYLKLTGEMRSLDTK